MMIITITYNQESESLVMAVNGKDRAGIIGPLSDKAYSNLLTNKIEELQQRANELHKWLLENIDHPNWRLIKSDFNALTVKIDNCKNKLEKKQYTRPVGLDNGNFTINKNK
jgi:hypothetical protein